MKKLAFIFCLVVLLSGCGPAAPNAGQPQTGQPGQTAPIQPEVALPTPILPPALSGDVEAQELLLTSHTRWNSLNAHAQVTLYPRPGVTAEADITTVQVWIEQPGKAKVISGRPQEAPTHTFISDGTNSRWENEPVQPLPPNINEPFNPPAAASDTVFPHPLGGMLGTPVSEMIFPAGIAQRGGEYHLTGRESVAGREALVVEWGRQPGELIDRLWIDAQTGIVLRWQNYGKENREVPASDMAITFIQVDAAIPAETFDLNSSDLPQLATPQPALDANTPQLRIRTDLDLVNVRSGPSTEYAVVVTLAPKMVARVTGKTAAGDWLQVDVDGLSGWVSAELVEVSGDLTAIPVVP